MNSFNTLDEHDNYHFSWQQYKEWHCFIIIKGILNCLLRDEDAFLNESGSEFATSYHHTHSAMNPVYME